MAAVSAAGLLYRTTIYPTDELLRTFVPNDIGNLCIGLPILLGSMWLARHGKLIGLLFWPGALFFVMYNYIVYVLAMPLSVAFMLQLALVTLSVYTMIGLVASIDGEAVQQRLTGAVPERLAGGVLVGLGLLFFVRVIGAAVGALTTHTPMAETELALNTTDFLIAPAWVIGGVLLWQRREFGYVIALADIVVVFILGLICFIPFVLFVRGVVSNRGSSTA
jgi:hypothetical protein